VSSLVVDEIGRGYAFRHALTRDAVYQEFLPGERVELHVAYAHAIDRDPALAGNDTSVAATLALHWYAAHDLPRALAASVLAGRQAIAGFAPAEARQHLERALEVWRSVPDAEQRAGVDEVDVLRLAARAAYDSGDPERALPLLDRAMELLGPESDPERIAQLVEQRATALRALGEDGASLEALEQALTRLPEEPPSLARAALLASLANALFRLNTSARAPQVARTALSAARAVDARGLEASALVTLGLALCYGPDPQDGEPAIREGLQVALDAGETETALRGYVNLSDVLESRGRHRDAADTAREGMELASRVGLTRNFGAYLAGNLAEPLVRLGEWDEAEQLATETLAAGLIGVFAASLHELLGYLAVHTGRPEQALKHVREARRQLGDSREAQFVQSLIYVEAEVARAAGQLAEGIALVTGGLTESDAWLARYSWPLAWLGARIEADIAIRARDLQQPVEPRPAVGGPTTVATSVPAVAAYRAMQQAEQLRGQVGAAPAWEAAVSACEQAEDAWPRAYTRFRWAEALCAAGDREAAAAPLREAHTEASRLGAAPLAEDILALARRSRLSLSDEVPGQLAPVVPEPFGLTDREREVLTLVAAGRSNGQIAKELFISPKTASVHVSNILAKLGVAGRVEAAGVAHRLGLTTEISAAGPDPGQGGGAPV
jgi:ATP/maltotriose-dependent transcriptional regulator MalT